MPSPLAHFFDKNREKKALQQAISKLIDDSELTPSFIFYSIVSAVLASLGIMMNNVTILIGAMLVAPLLIPILSLAVGLGAGSLKLIGHSLKSLTVGLGCGLLSAALTAYLIGDFELSKDIYNAFAHQDLYIIVAFLSGILAVYTWFKSNSNLTMPGVAIAVALVPPLAFVGLLLPLKQQNGLVDLLQLLFLNMGGILLGALLTFLILRFLHSQKNSAVDAEVEKGVEKNRKK